MSFSFHFIQIKKKRPNISGILVVETHYVQDSSMNRKFKRTAFICNSNLLNIICNIHVFTVTFDHINTFLLNASVQQLRSTKPWFVYEYCVSSSFVVLNKRKKMILAVFVGCSLCMKVVNLFTNLHYLVDQEVLEAKENPFDL